ncbi:MAG: FAD-binding oxidoreductase [Rhodospirillaceae bacterium]|nr:FAD-binding oxidoreductase [Rhodospirillaceae bacterium]MBL6929849.1 FAD-binding oxidoreductase [Rhodospirillales bacterium]
MTTRYDAIIIGAGIIGSCMAFEMAKKGWKTLNVDRLPAAGYGSTSFSCAIIRTHYSTLDGTALAYENYFHWLDWAGYLGVPDELGHAELRHCGCLVMKTPKNNGLKHMIEHMKILDIPWQDWSPDDILNKLPFMDLANYSPPKLPTDPGFAEPTGGRIEGGIFFPCAGYMNDPQLSTHNVQRAAEAHGAEFRFKADVTAIRQENGRVQGITLADGSEIDAPVVVNVAGPHSSKINEMAGVADKMALTTRALREEVAYIPGPQGFDIEKDGMITSDSDVGSYSRPEVGNRILVGSENPECDPEEWVDADHYSTDPTDQMRYQVMRLAQRMPTLGIPEHPTGVVSLYDVTPDWIPIYDKSDLNGFYLAIGSSGNQYKNAPVAGKMMTALIEACEKGQDHDNEPVIYTLERLKRPLNVGFFSRNRAINEDSSFSVLG